MQEVLAEQPECARLACARQAHLFDKSRCVVSRCRLGPMSGASGAPKAKMGRPPRSTTGKLGTHRAALRLTDDEHEAYSALAARAEQSLSDWIRAACEAARRRAEAARRRAERQR